MKKLYKDFVSMPSVWRYCFMFFCAAAYIVCCLPSFYWIGKFAIQIFSAVILSSCVTMIAFFCIPRSLRVLSGGLSLFLMAMIVYALYKQVIAQIESGSSTFWWIYTFFYDRPLTVSVVWGAAFVSILLLRLLLPNREEYAAFRSDFAVFFQTSFRWFLVFYALVLVYCFILQRQPGVQSGFNLIPFSMLSSYLQAFRYSYETIFYVIGNILCFLPIGFYVSVRRSGTPVWRIVLVPIVCSLLIEASQLILNMGHFDVDDIIMNAVGYYLGFWAARLFDFVRSRITAGEETTIFQHPDVIA